MNEMIESRTKKRPKLYPPLALIAKPAGLPFRLPPGELRRLVAMMVD
jgi:hypothetical protein